MLTTAEAAALLSERGITTANGRAISAQDVQRWCWLGWFPGAMNTTGTRRGTWLIPREDVEAFQPRKVGRPKGKMMKTQFNGVTNVTVRDVRYRGEIVIPQGTRVEVDDSRSPGWARYNGKVYSVRLEQMSAHEIQIDGQYIPGCGPDA